MIDLQKLNQMKVELLANRENVLCQLKFIEGGIELCNVLIEGEGEQPSPSESVADAEQTTQ